MLHFQVLSDEELKGPEVSPGTYNGAITTAEFCKSKAGNDQMKIFIIFDVNGRAIKVKDYLSVPWKIKQICDAINKPHLYKEGKISELDLRGCKLTADLKFGNPNEDGNRYLEVKRYVPYSANVLQIANEFDDKITF